MTTNGVRAAIYLRVSRDDQTTENQRLVLARVANHRGWLIVQSYETRASAVPRVGISVPRAVRRRYDSPSIGSDAACSTQRMRWRNSMLSASFSRAVSAACRRAVTIPRPRHNSYWVESTNAMPTCYRDSQKPGPAYHTRSFALSGGLPRYNARTGTG